MQRESIRECIDGAERYLVKGYVDSDSLINNIDEAISEEETKKLIHSHKAFANL